MEINHNVMEINHSALNPRGLIPRPAGELRLSRLTPAT